MSREKLSDSPLKKVVWQAVIDGPLMSYTSSQQYHNDRKDPVEINYSFPLPYGKSVISKFRANINGVVREGKAYPKKEAEQKYEDAIESGDTPIVSKGRLAEIAYPSFIGVDAAIRATDRRSTSKS